METRENTTELNFFEDPRFKEGWGMFITEDKSFISYSKCLVNEYLVPSKFQFIQRTYFPSGALKAKKVFGFGRWESSEFYDEEGYLIERVENEPVKDEVRIEGLDIVSFLEKEGWFNRATGKCAYFLDYPPITGEMTYEVFRNIGFSHLKDDPTKIRITLENPDLPRPFLEKHGVMQKSGNLWLPTEPGTPDGGKVYITYIVDTITGTYDVSWYFNMVEC